MGSRRRALVTGAGGFVGANLVRRLAAEGFSVTAAIRPGGDAWRLDGAPVDVAELDLADPVAVDALIRILRPSFVFHLAAHGAYPHQARVHQIVRTNVVGTVNLLEACLDAGFEAFVNTGSSSEYGFKDHAPTEDEALEPNSDYAWTKAAATHFCRHRAAATGLRIPTLRLYSVYGPYEQPGRLIPALVVHGMAGRLPPLVDPGISRDFVYIDDVCDAYLLAATRSLPEPGAVFNVGTGTQISLGEAVEVARRRFGIAQSPEWGTMPNRSWDTSVWVSQPARIGRELGWQPKHGFQRGFDRCVEWFEAHPDLALRYGAPAVEGTSPIG
ncbi:MAG TPA: NAD-dependent epimerase/dehydratase family protein [Actinomycetota bacterium]|nr:NAD-dependent epimerase/dehydratase family protein [Actinomycetota bacterium]